MRQTSRPAGREEGNLWQTWTENKSGEDRGALGRAGKRKCGIFLYIHKTLCNVVTAVYYPKKGISWEDAYEAITRVVG